MSSGSVTPLFDEYDYDVLSVDKKILSHYNTALSSRSLKSQHRDTLKNKLETLTNQNKEKDRVLLRYSEIKFLHECLNENDQGSLIHLYELMELATLQLPSPAPPVKSEEYVARMDRLRRLAEEAEYQKMTQNVSTTMAQANESIGKELRQMDNQATFLLNFVLTVLGAFIFGYKGVEYSMAAPTLSLQLTVGVTLATIVFFADVYFIVKKYV